MCSELNISLAIKLPQDGFQYHSRKLNHVIVCSNSKNENSIFLLLWKVVGNYFYEKCDRNSTFWENKLTVRFTNVFSFYLSPISISQKRRHTFIKNKRKTNFEQLPKANFRACNKCTVHGRHPPGGAAARLFTVLWENWRTYFRKTNKEEKDDITIIVFPPTD